MPPSYWFLALCIAVIRLSNPVYIKYLGPLLCVLSDASKQAALLYRAQPSNSIAALKCGPTGIHFQSTIC